MGNLKKLLLFVVLLCSGFIEKTKAQQIQQSIPPVDFNQYRPASCFGEVPYDFKKKSSEKANEEIREIKAKDLAKSEKQQEKDHAVAASFAIDQMLSSGQVLYGEHMSQYVEDVAEKLLIANQQEELYNKLRFYVLKSYTPNAYTTSNGAVIVTVGLLSRIENEAQLAFILSHEIQHYVLKHGLKQYKKIEYSKTRTAVNKDNIIKDIYRFSKENEMEADLKGFDMMVKAGYNLNEGIYVFDMLKYADYPFLEITLSIDSFENKLYKFPAEFKTKIRELVKKQNEEDEKSLVDDGNDENNTHPSLDRRINIMRDKIDATGSQKGKPAYLLSKDRFEFVSKIARHELLLIYIKRADFGMSFYLSYMMEKLYGKSSFLGEIRAMSLYGIFHHAALDQNLDKYGCDPSSAKGDWKPIIAALKEMEKKELAAFGAAEMYRIYEQNKQNEFIYKLCKEYFKLVQTKALIRLDDFLVGLNSENKDTTSVTVEEETNSSQQIKNPRNRVKRSTTTGAAVNDYYMYAFAFATDRPKLEKFFTEMKFSEISNSDIPIENTELKPDSKHKAKTDPINKLVLFQPNIQILYGSDKNRNLYEEESLIEYFGQHWKKIGLKADLPVEIVKTSFGQNQTTEDINAHMALNDWMAERLNNDTQSMVLYNSRYVSTIMKNYNANHIGWVNYELNSTKRPFSIEACYAAVVVFPLFPIYLIWQLQTVYNYKEISIVFNTETGSTTHVGRKSYSHGLKDDFLNAQIYETLYRIKNK